MKKFFHDESMRAYEEVFKNIIGAQSGLEPARSCLRGILNPLCLPIPPPGHW